jgi:hypothetical protein
MDVFCSLMLLERALSYLKYNRCSSTRIDVYSYGLLYRQGFELFFTLISTEVGICSTLCGMCAMMMAAKAWEDTNGKNL